MLVFARFIPREKENVHVCFLLRKGKIKSAFKTHSVTRPPEGSKDILSSPPEYQVSDSKASHGNRTGVSLLTFPSLLDFTIDMQNHLSNAFSV